MSITYDLENPSDKQKSDLELAQLLLDNLNSIKPPHVNKTTLKDDGEDFNVVKTGFAHKFLIDDIHLSINNDIDKHKEFILDRIRNEFKDYDLGRKSKASHKNLEILTTSIIEYYKIHPLYNSNSDFKSFIDKLDKSVNIELKA